MKTRRAVAQLLTSALIGCPLLARPAAGRSASAAEAYRIDAATSQVTIDVGKAGVLSFAAGHTHQVVGPIEGGTIEFDREEPSRSRVRIVIGTAALKVSPKGEPEGDAPKVQEAMDGEKVLDVPRYPRIVFESTSVAPSATHASTPSSTVAHPQPGTALDLTIGGRLTIRDVTRSVSVPVRVEIAANSVTATGRFSVKQTAYGITPISVGGVVAVKDALDLRFKIVAHR